MMMMMTVMMVIPGLNFGKKPIGIIFIRRFPKLFRAMNIPSSDVCNVLYTTNISLIANSNGCYSVGPANKFMTNGKLNWMKHLSH